MNASGRATDQERPRTQIEQVAATLRNEILLGHLAPETRLMEIPIADSLGVSRTPVRVALGLLEREGLVKSAGPKRGFVVRSFDSRDVFDAIELRGHLEGMAARQIAEQGASEDVRARLVALVEAGAAVLRMPPDSLELRTRWKTLNADLHSLLVDSAPNRLIADHVARLNLMPLVSPSAFTFVGESDEDARKLRRAQEDHSEIVESILARQSARAESLVREHALRNVRNKTENFAAIKARFHSRDLPGLGLVRPSVVSEPKP